MKTVIIVGAGATLSDAMGKSLSKKPPLDSGFFSACEKFGYSELPGILMRPKFYRHFGSKVYLQSGCRKNEDIFFGSF